MAKIIGSRLKWVTSGNVSRKKIIKAQNKQRWPKIIS